MELRLTAGAVVEPATEQGLGVDLAGQVYGDGVVDGDVVGVGGNVSHVEDMVGVPEFYQRVFLSELNLGGGAAHQTGEDCLALVNGLSATVDNAPFYEREDARGRHLGVPAEVLFVVEDAQARKVDARECRRRFERNLRHGRGPWTYSAILSIGSGGGTQPAHRAQPRTWEMSERIRVGMASWRWMSDIRGEILWSSDLSSPSGRVSRSFWPASMDRAEGMCSTNRSISETWI